MAPSNLDAAITVRSAGAELQSTIELRATAPEIAAPKPDLGVKAKINDFEALCKGIVKGKSPVSKLRTFADKSLYRNLDAATLEKTIYSITHAAATPSRKAKLSCQTSLKN